LSLKIIHNEKVLLLQIAEGDETAFGHFFHLYFPLLYPAVFKIVKIGSVTEDIIQDTFMRVWIYRDKLPEIENPKAWIYRIAYHQAFTYLQKNNVRQNAIKKISETANQDILKNETEEMLAFKAVASKIKEAVQNLPKQQKKAYQLSREQGLKIDEIAVEMNLSNQSVKNTLGRALKFIREHIKNAGF
jgi:RNA polymerase sigma-70 factor (family 1)